MSQWPAATVRYVLIGYVLIPLAINVVINVLLGWLLFLDQESIPVWGSPQSVAMEVVGTGFLLPLITAMISSRILIRHLHSGMVQPIHEVESNSGIVSRLVSWVGRILRDASIGGCLSFSVVVFPFLTIPAFLGLLDFHDDSVGPFTLIAVKAVYAGLCGLVVTPLIAVGLLREANHSPE
ncbi:hypothetical protein RBSH_05617 [Rhodopirellula baltica SH28]|uniref:Uncharacterized protein n=1 Tax=Rhodopirellula baltica SH28 TaxID=993517 RepID=K5DZX3_RHOBT|nr:hypothetical protein [Rhodopirellula baltica]EKJ99030.1 hypothetical protein RBSH_05617 [Rhodopirellula baltica SH28]